MTTTEACNTLANIAPNDKLRGSAPAETEGMKP